MQCDVNLRFLAGLSGVMLAIALRTDVGTLKQLELEPTNDYHHEYFVNFW